jgi:adenylate cyclase class IV
MKPFKLAPAYKDYIWGGKKLKEKYGKNTDVSPLAESWELSCHDDGLSVIKNGEYDIVHCHTPNASVITRLVCRRFRKKTGLKVFYTAHGFHFYRGAPLINWLLYYRVEKQLAKMTNWIVTINREDYERAKKFKGSKICYIPGVGIDVEKFIRLLELNNAKFVGDWLQIRNCYDFNPVRENSWIRLRTNGKETTLTIKEISNNNIDGTKESEIVVSDFETTDEILNKLGYTARSRQENRRIRYILDGVEIDIDFWPYIPTYVEFEAKSQEDIEKVCLKLKIDFNKLTTLDVSSIYDYYGFKLTQLPRVITLEEDRKTQNFNK